MKGHADIYLIRRLVGLDGGGLENKLGLADMSKEGALRDRIWLPDYSRDAWDVTAHELGHTFGLDDRYLTGRKPMNRRDFLMGRSLLKSKYPENLHRFVPTEDLLKVRKFAKKLRDALDKAEEM